MNKNMQSMAFFMICLVVSLPIYVSDAYANINRVTAQGTEGIPNFVLPEYDLTITADASLDSGSPKKEQVRLKNPFDNNAVEFDSCSPSGNSSSSCTINIVKDENTPLEICPQKTFEVQLYDSYPGIPVDTKTVAVKCDSQGPSVSVSVTPQIIKSGNIMLSYSISDEPITPMTRCSGIERIEYYFNSVSSGAAPLNINTTPCTYSNTLPHDISSYGDGLTTIIVKAYDRMGNSNSGNASFIVDKRAPSASASAEITDAYGNAIPYFTPQNVLVDIILNINDATGVSDYRINAASITSSSPTCVNSDTNLVCRWNNIPVYMNNATFSKTITLSATDIVGNNASLSVPVTQTINQDLVLPVVSIGNLTTGTADGSFLEWFRPGNFKASFSADVTDDLSGIKSISGDFSQLQIVSGDTPICTGSGNHYKCSWPALVFYSNTPSFNKQIRIIATDNAGNQKAEPKTISFNYKPDNSAPIMSGFSLVRTDSANLSRWIGKQDVPLRISIDVNEKGAGLKKVTADLSNLNPSYRSSEGSCVETSSPAAAAVQTTAPQGGIYAQYSGNTSQNSSIVLPEYGYRCTWSINARFNTSGNPYTANIDFNATDNSLNTAILSATQAFMVDVDGPTISSLTTGREFNGIYYVGTSSNEFLVGVSDAGVGFNNSNIYLDLSGIGFDLNHKVDSCSSDGYCKLTMPPCLSANDGVHTISVTTRTVDNLGNNLAQAFYANVTLDKVSPAVNSINVSAVAATTELYRDYIQTGNALLVVVNVTEATSLFTATADFSNFIGDADNVLADSCERISDGGNETDEWTCIWTTDDIDITEYKKDKIYFNFTDVAGNSIIEPFEIEVFEALNGTADFWTNNVGESSPKAIDRQIVTFYQPFMWFPVQLTSNSGKSAQDLWPLEVSLDGCLSERGNNSNSTPAVNYLSSANGNKPLMLNPNTENPTNLPYILYMDYIMEQSAPSEDSLSITCQLKIKTLVDGTKISPYEIENYTVTIKYYNNPLGRLDNNIIREIKDVSEGWLVKAKWMDSLQKLLNIADIICKLFQQWHRITMIYAYVASGFSNCCAATVTSGACCPAQQAGATGTDVSKKASKSAWEQYGKKFCAFTGCTMWSEKWSDGEGIMKKWANIQQGWISKYYSPVVGQGTRYQAQILDIKSSLILSIFFICIPGVIYNLQKARAIDCNYISCLKSTMGGAPLQKCVRQRDYGWCKYVYGQIFNLIPFANIISDIVKNVKKALSHLAEMIGFVLDIACSATCRTPAAGSICPYCTALEMLNWLLDILCDLGVGDGCEGFWDELTVDNNVCKDALKNLP
jgi:hypothetical protein